MAKRRFFLCVLCSFPPLTQATQTLQYLSPCFMSSLTWCCQGKQGAVEKLFSTNPLGCMCERSLCHSLNPASPFSWYFNKTIYLSGQITRMFYRPKNPRRAIKTPQLERRPLKTWRRCPKTGIYRPTGPEWVHRGGNVVENIIPKKCSRDKQ